jgi:hypothetical protein
VDSRSLLPPMSTTSLPSSAEPVAGPPSDVKPPILASDILREEVAPLAPAAAAMRSWLLALAASFGLLAATSYEGVLPVARFALEASLVTAGAAGVAWTSAVPYSPRAALGALAGALPLVLGIEGMGPLSILGAEGRNEAAAMLVLLTVLPAALFFRARYRAFGAARAFLAVALLLAAPAVLLLGRGSLATGTPFAVRLCDMVVVIAILATFSGFLGAETTGACTIWGVALLVLTPTRDLVAALAPDASASRIGGATAGCLGLSLAGTVVSLALYQLLAATFARRARRVDVHRIVGPSAEES